MKKLATVMLTMLSCGAIYALPLGNPSEASLLRDGLFWEGNCDDPCANLCDAWSFRIGYYGDFVFNRHLEVSEGFTKGRDIEHTELYTNAGYIALNFWDRWDIFTTVGATNFRLTTNASAFALVAPVASGGNRFHLESNTSFSWSIGSRLTLWECGCTSFGIEGQYFRTKPDIERVTLRKAVSVYPDIDMTYSEWQVGIGVSYRIWNLVPYFGAKYSSVHTHLSGQFEFGSSPTVPQPFLLNDLENKKNGAFVIGVSLIDCEKAALTVEGRWPDEKAVYVNGQVRF